MAKIEKRGNSSYRLTVSCGYDKEGKQIVKRRTIDLSSISVKKRDSEAEKQFTLFQEEIKKGQYVDNEKITFEEFIDKWIKDYASVSIQPRTLEEYELLLKRIIPAMGHIKLINLQPTHLTEFYNNLREEGIRLDTRYSTKKTFVEIISKYGLELSDLMEKSNVTNRTITNLKQLKNIQEAIAIKISKSIGVKPEVLFDISVKPGGLSERTILHHHRLISTILASALQWGFILSNPALRIKAPRVAKKEAKHFNIEQTEQILYLLEDAPLKYQVMITLAIYGGMREGELNALTWSDIIFERAVINIDKALQHTKSKGTFIKSTKTENTRLISIDEEVMDLLKKYRKWQNEERLKLGDLWKGSNYLFTAINGGFISPGTVSKWFLKFIRKHNESIMNNKTIKEEDKPSYLINQVNFHGLRHTSATLLINQGTDISTVSKRLGHARTSTTMDIYSHSLQKADVEASNKLGNLLNKKSRNKEQGYQ